ncbi:GNAT family N-acetyltransferase [Leifsonia sp. 21MFCrub1.1]|uniref:GNAT family N-acetyltransferase n=1 Tax=Leifsonia sp. 21MFCrub1.1 TaxID=1798223 RepID=UPI00089282D3|nr:GNAT family N-acetyltransferase [Leifsonia sp. 21MFCrub1.1]SEA87743.1 Acetyltransferase (GNAT) domain-containing protein [Leifsonia sp. 21MFCrub1.1]
MGSILVERVTEESAEADAAALSSVLAATVAAGASVGWITAPSGAEATDWWRALFADPDAASWVARGEDGRAIGTVTLLRSPKPNGSHRGEVIKLMVHPAARGRGVAPALMAELERHAVETGLTLLVLDTETGSRAEALYRRWGWDAAGSIPDFAVSPSGVLHGTTVMYKRLGRGGDGPELFADSQAARAE